MSTYSLKDKTLEVVRTERDLGVWVSYDLTWGKQVPEQAACANRLLAFIKGNTHHI